MCASVKTQQVGPDCKEKFIKCGFRFRLFCQTFFFNSVEDSESSSLSSDLAPLQTLSIREKRAKSPLKVILLIPTKGMSRNNGSGNSKFLCLYHAPDDPSCIHVRAYCDVCLHLLHLHVRPAVQNACEHSYVWCESYLPTCAWRQKRSSVHMAQGLAMTDLLLKTAPTSGRFRTHALARVKYWHAD